MQVLFFLNKLFNVALNTIDRLLLCYTVIAASLYLPSFMLQPKRQQNNDKSTVSFVLTLFQIPPCYICPFTCSSNRLITAWTHSTGLCAAMVRRMQTAGAPPPGSPKSEPLRLMQHTNQPNTPQNLTARKHK